MSDIGKLQRPEASTAMDASELAGHESAGGALEDPAAARGRAGGELQYRASGGAHGVAPMQRLMDERRAMGGRLAARVQRKGDGAAAGNVAIPESGGAKLPGAVRAKMEPKLGADLSDVQVHTGGESAQAASGLGARAFTVGNDVHFGAGEFAPGSKEGDRLIAHELTHVVQGKKSGVQRKADEHGGGADGRGGGGEHAHGAEHGGGEVSHPDEPAEKEADAVADGVTDQLHGGGKDAKGKDKNKKDKNKNADGAHGDADAAHGSGDAHGADAYGGHGADAHAGGAHAGGPEAAHAGGGAQAAGGGAQGAASSALAEKPAPISAKFVGVGRKIFRTKGGSGSTAPATTPPLKPTTNPQAKELENEFKLVKPVATLDAYNAMIQSLSLLVTSQSKASVNLRVTKLKDAIARTRVKLAEIYKDKAPALINDWIDSRLPQAHAKPGPEFLGKAQAAKDGLLNSPTIDPKLQVDAAKPLVNYQICAPEEAATDKMMDESGGIMKVFDVGSMWWSMDAKYQDAWRTKFGADAEKQFTNACKSQKALVTAPPGQENKPPFKGASIDAVFTKPLSGFVGQGKDAGAVGNFADAIQRFALNPGYYPSGAMFVISAGAADVKQKKNSGAIKIGKPSMFNLLNFDENVYKEDDRQYGHLADPKDPSKAGNALELTCQGYPGEIYSSAKYLG